MENASSPTLSVVVPAFNEEESVGALYARLTAVLGGLGESYEVVFMDNDSSDGTGLRVKELCAKDGRWRYVRLSRNFGYQLNIAAGIGYARGEAIVVMDADLQDPPELIAEFLREWRAGHDIVYGVRSTREGEPRWRQAAMRGYYRLLHTLSPIEIPVDAGDFRLISRRVQREFLRFPESSRYSRGIFAFIGFRQKGIPYARRARAAGQSKFPLLAMINLGLDGIISFSMLPIRVMHLFGVAILLAGLAYALFAVSRFISGQTPPGWTTNVILLLLLSGVQILFLSLLGEYIGRIYLDAKRRPLWIVAEEMNVARPPAA